MLESIEKLRDWATRPDGSFWRPEIGEFSDAIEREISERYMLLPVDADGVPIHVGEIVLDYDTNRPVVAVTPNAIVMSGYQDGDSIRIGYAVNHSHAKSRTVEIVRCKDCRYFKPELYNYISCEYLLYNTGANDFCSYGERKSTDD